MRNYATEFNAEEYNIPPFINPETGWEDNSWKNDTFPRFHNAKHKICLWIAPTKPEDRVDVGNSPRFAIQEIDSYQEDGADLFATDSEEQLLAYLLALEFSAILQNDLTIEELSEVIRLNQTPEYADCCATHNYCDPNQSMLDAWEVVLQREFSWHGDGANIDPEKDKQLWNAAWDIARSNKFFVSMIPLTKFQELKLMIIENFIDHWTTMEEERERMKKDARLYVEEDHASEQGNWTTL